MCLLKPILLPILIEHKYEETRLTGVTNQQLNLMNNVKLRHLNLFPMKEQKNG
jgi:hypothetical protein